MYVWGLHYIIYEKTLSSSLKMKDLDSSSRRMPQIKRWWCAWVTLKPSVRRLTLLTWPHAGSSDVSARSLQSLFQTALCVLHFVVLLGTWDEANKSFTTAAGWKSPKLVGEQLVCSGNGHNRAAVVTLLTVSQLPLLMSCDPARRQSGRKESRWAGRADEARLFRIQLNKWHNYHVLRNVRVNPFDLWNSPTSHLSTRQKHKPDVISGIYFKGRKYFVQKKHLHVSNNQTQNKSINSFNKCTKVASPSSGH